MPKTDLSATTVQSLLETVCDIACRAGERIMHYYTDDIAVERKGDDSPVTQADIEANRLILEALAGLRPRFPIVSEEAATIGDVESARYFWLVDPLDGTKSFIRREGQFTVNIALVEQGGLPVLGAVYVPATGALYAGAEGLGATLREGGAGPRAIRVRPSPPEGLHVVASKSHLTPETEAFLRTIPVAERVSASSSVKFCLLAEGKADCYPRFGRTMEWDTAAGQAVLQAAGGRVETPDGHPFTYGKTYTDGEEDFANGFFIAYGG